MEGLSSQIRDAGGVELEPDARGGEEAGAGGRPWQGHLVRLIFLRCSFFFVDQEKVSQE